MCAFASFSRIFFSYDSRYISRVMGMPYFINLYTYKPIPSADTTDAEKKAFSLPAKDKSLITSILFASTFFRALIAGNLTN